ncbi:hypothetical protein G6F40_016695 [Rhizopus arrhizus]|nr:hypothetical protein G6F40_016695 [Rhizopus arrhizus]
MRGRVHGGRAHRVVGTLAWPVYRRQRSEQAASKPFSRDAPCRRLGRACWHLAGPAGAGHLRVVCLAHVAHPRIAAAGAAAAGDPPAGTRPQWLCAVVDARR